MNNFIKYLFCLTCLLGIFPDLIAMETSPTTNFSKKRKAPCISGPTEATQSKNLSHKNTPREVREEKQPKRAKKIFPSNEVINASNSFMPRNKPFRLFAIEDSSLSQDACPFIGFINNPLSIQQLEEQEFTFPEKNLCAAGGLLCQKLTLEQQNRLHQIYLRIRKNLLKNFPSPFFIKFVKQCFNHGLILNENYIDLLVLAGKLKNKELLQQFLQKNALGKVRNISLAYAIFIEDEESISNLLNLCVCSSSSHSQCGFPADDSYSPLMLAVMMENITIVSLILNHNSTNQSSCKKNSILVPFLNNPTKLIPSSESINVQNPQGLTALMIAAENGFTSAIEVLFYKGAKINQMDNNKCSALWFASREGHVETVQKLLDFNSYPNRDNLYKITPLMIAAYRGHVEVVRCLLKYGAKVNMQDFDGSTALLFACKEGHLEIAQSLLEYGALAWIPNYSALLTPLMSACEYKHPEIVVLLLNLNHPLLISAKDCSGNTPFMIACENGDLTIVKQLLPYYKQRLKEVNYEHKSALILASNNKHKEVVLELLNANQ